MNQLAASIAALHFLRPVWLWALLLLPFAVALWAYRRRRASAWTRVVDPHLLPSLLVGAGRRSWFGAVPLMLTYALAVTALAGPSWRQDTQPLFRAQVPLVVIFDLSSSIHANDLAPSRLLQARAKLATLLRERVGGDVALIAFAGESFTVAPLTADVANVALFLDALSPEVMPVDGKRTDSAIDAAVRLLQQARYSRGEILLFSDVANARARAAAQSAAQQGYKVSALGLGTARGAAYRDMAGQIQLARLDESELRSLVASGGGRYARLSDGDADLHALGVLNPSQISTVEGMKRSGSLWLDQGYWLLPPVMLLTLLAFRRRGVTAVLVFAGLLPLTMPARAADDGGLWQRADQTQQQRLDAGVRAYRSGDFVAAQDYFAKVDSGQGLYNLGNALARQGHYDEAIAAYDHALQQQPGMADAQANRAIVEAARKRQQQNQKRKQGQQNQQNQPQQSGRTKPSQRDKTAQTESAQSSGNRQAPAKQGQSQAASSANAQPGEAPKQGGALTQQQADQAQQQSMQQAIDRKRQQPGQSGESYVQEDMRQREQRQAMEAWLRQIPDDPGSLLRSKFRLEYERRQREAQWTY